MTNPAPQAVSFAVAVAKPAASAVAVAKHVATDAEAEAMTFTIAVAERATVAEAIAAAYAVSISVAVGHQLYKAHTQLQNKMLWFFTTHLEKAAFCVNERSRRTIQFMNSTPNSGCMRVT